jgi:DNA-directed RNA polymerase specialized sigma24 family protein
MTESISKVAGTLPPRVAAVSLTDVDLQLFAEAWKTVGPRLERTLRRLGASPVQAQDVAQEVALRALARRVRFGGDEDLLRWCNIVARNLLFDEHRSAARHPTTALDAAADIADPADVHRCVEGRLRLRHVVSAFNDLSESDKVAIRTSEGLAGEPARSRMESTRLAVRRHRARARLSAIAGGPNAVIVIVLGWLKGARKSRWAAVASVPTVFAFAALTAVSPAAARPPAFADMATRPHLAQQTQPKSDVAAASEPTRQYRPRDAVRDPGIRHAAVRAQPRPDQARVTTPGGGLAVGTGTQPNPSKVLICISVGPPLEPVCADRPAASPSDAPAPRRPAAAPSQVRVGW